jgi:hypothetical protein
MAGGNKGSSPKVIKRQLQEQTKARKEAAEKKRRTPNYNQ